MDHRLQAENAEMVFIFEHLQDLAGEGLDTDIVEVIGQISRMENQLFRSLGHRSGRYWYGKDWNL